MKAESQECSYRALRSEGRVLGGEQRLRQGDRRDPSKESETSKGRERDDATIEELPGFLYRGEGRGSEQDGGSGRSGKDQQLGAGGRVSWGDRCQRSSWGKEPVKTI